MIISQCQPASHTYVTSKIIYPSPQWMVNSCYFNTKLDPFPDVSTNIATRATPQQLDRHIAARATHQLPQAFHHRRVDGHPRCARDVSGGGPRLPVEAWVLSRNHQEQQHKAETKKQCWLQLEGEENLGCTSN